jgi:hypothetical protein
MRRLFILVTHRVRRPFSVFERQSARCSAMSIEKGRQNARPDLSPCYSEANQNTRGRYAYQNIAIQRGCILGEDCRAD